MQELIEQHIAYFKQIGDKALKRTTGRIQLICSYTPSKIAGSAWPTQWKIKINIPLHELNPTELKDTVGHEIAHLYAPLLYNGTRGHGPGWKRTMMLFGLSPERCHRMNTKGVGKNTSVHLYRCSDCDAVIKLSNKRHSKIRSGKYRLRHTSCPSSMLIFVRSTTKHELDNVTPLVKIPVAARHPAPATGSKKGRTKIEQAAEIYLANPDLPRREIILMFIDKLNMTKAGASTYYANCKKKFAK